MKEQIFYLDENNNLVEKENAYKCIIRRVDDKGKLILENTSYLHDVSNDSYDDKELSEEDLEILNVLFNPNYKNTEKKSGKVR